MTEAAPSPDSPHLSESLEAAVYSACFGSDPDVALATLIENRPQARAAIEGLALRVRRAAGCLQGARRATPADAASPPATIGPYQVVRELGRGGFGAVYLVEQREPIRRRLALKVLRSDFPTDELLRRFEGERQVLASMNHPGIATIVEAGRTGIGQPFLAMEWIEGPPITTFADHKRLSVRERLQLFLGVCSAVAHAHQRGVLHRDLKPANILIADPDGQPLPKVIDFGLAKLRRVEEPAPGLAPTCDGRLLGTPEYMSPEQARGEPLDSRTDVYALGAVLYELLTGRLPFLASQLLAGGLASVAQVLTEQRAPSASRAVGDENAARNRGLTPALLARRLRGDLDAVVACCLERDREARYENVAALAADLRRLLAGDPVMVVRPGSLRLLRDFGRRHRLLSSVVLAMSLGGLIATAATTWSLWRVSDARDAAVASAQASERALYAASLTAAAAAGEACLGGEMRHQLAVAPPTLRGIEWHLLAAQAEDAHSTLPIGQRHPAGMVPWAAGSQVLLSFRSPPSIDRIEPRTGLSTSQALGSVPLALAADARGERFAVATVDGAVLVHDQHGAPPRLRIRLAAAVARALAFANTEPVLAVADGRDLVLHAHDRGTELARRQGHRAPIEAIAVAADDSLLASGDQEGTVKLWRRGEAAAHATVQHGHCVRQLRFVDGDRRLVSSGEDGVLRLWSVATGERIAAHDTRAHRICALALSSDGQQLVSGGGDGSFRYWDAATLESLGNGRGHADYIAGTARMDDGRFASASFDGTLRIFEAKTRPRRAPLTGLPGNATRLTRTPGGDTLYCGTLAGHLGAFRIGSTEARWTRDLGAGFVQGLVALTGEQIVVTTLQGVVGRIDGNTGAELRRVEVADSPLGNIVRRADGMLLTTAAGRLLELEPVDLTTRSRHELPWSGDAAAPPGLELTLAPDEQLLLAAAADHGLAAFSLRSTHRPEARWHRQDLPCSRAMFTSDGSEILAASTLGFVFVLDPITGGERRRFGKGAGHPIIGIAGNRDGSRILTCDQRLRFWDGRHGTELLAIGADRYPPAAILLAEDQGVLFTGSGHFEGPCELLAWPLEVR